MKNLIIYLSIILLTSCINDQKIKQDAYYNDNNYLSGKILPLDDIVVIPMQIIVRDSLVFINEFRRDYLLSIWNLNNGELIKKVLPVGDGPNEFQPPVQLNYNEENDFLEVYDRIRFKYTEYHINDILDLELIKSSGTFPANLRNVSKINNNMYIGEGVMETGRFSLLSDDENEVKRMGTFPDFELIINQKDGEINNIHKGMIFQSILALNPNSQKFVSAAKQVGAIDFYRFDSQLNFEVIKQVKLSPDIKIKSFKYGNSHNVKFEDSNLKGFYDLYATSDAVYALYSGRSIEKDRDKSSSANIIIIYNWDGDEVKRLTLDYDITCFAYDPMNKRIVGVSEGKNDEVSLLIFNIFGE
jgi:hypothetical protein